LKITNVFDVILREERPKDLKILHYVQNDMGTFIYSGQLTRSNFEQSKEFDSRVL